MFCTYHCSNSRGPLFEEYSVVTRGTGNDLCMVSNSTKMIYDLWWVLEMYPLKGGTGCRGIIGWFWCIVEHNVGPNRLGSGARERPEKWPKKKSEVSPLREEMS